ncbi:MAG: adenosylcobalamin-dependent ribonucleoside-diphosphate reductase, partial [Rhodobacteraceae bacterium]|nr:adenosylcobalamin-dependent ribonucleoside-diphosphate reductase [Paracoccaceae bacterium]
MSAGSRRGAMMATMRCDHPDIEDFIAAKSDPARLRMFNLSVLATDPFMEAVKGARGWDLVFGGKVWKTVQARDLWNRIMESTFGYAEPGVIFIDRINERNNLHYCETISATNPCGEQPLPPYGACLLGSINLARLVRDPFEWGPTGLSQADIDEDELDRLVATAVRMMDNVIDVSGFPLDAQREEALAKRRIGLGVTGLADALLMKGKRYGSNGAASLTQRWMGGIARAAYLASADLAAEKGPFPLFERDAFLAGPMMQSMDEEVREAVATKGIRNALLTSIAPTGTISLLAGNVSSGIEPVFAFSYNRKVLQPDGAQVEEEVVDYAVRLWRELYDEKPLPANFVDAQSLKPKHHVRMQAAIQKWVDSSISKTINCPADIEFKDFRAVYMSAWDQGCKGCTTYRPNEVTGSVLSVGAPEVPAVENSPVRPANVEPLARPDALEGRTYKIRWPDSEHALYVTINDALHSGRRFPFEIFINSKNMEHYAWTLALTRMISAVFRRGGDVRFVAEELRAVFDPTGGAWVGGRYVPSILALLGDVIEQHLGTVGYDGADFHVRQPDDPPGAPVVGAIAASGSCSACGSPAVIRREGCLVCRECGHSKCQ